MKDPILEFEKQSKKLNEIFGSLSNLFKSKEQKAKEKNRAIINKNYNDAIVSRNKRMGTDQECAGLDVGNKYNKKVSGQGPIKIGNNKIINNIDGLKIEDRNGNYRKSFPTDFRCYDVVKDPYGIKWLFNDGVSYEAASLSGYLDRGEKAQHIHFVGVWNGRVIDLDFNGSFKKPKNTNQFTKNPKTHVPLNISTKNKAQKTKNTQVAPQKTTVKGPIKTGGKNP